MSKSVPNKEIEKTNLNNDLDLIEKEINHLKNLYKEIDTYTDVLVDLFNKKYKMLLEYIEKCKPGTSYQKALHNLVFKKYIPNPELNNPGMFLEVKKFFTEIPKWIIDDEENYKEEQKNYDIEREKTGEFLIGNLDEKIKKILDTERDSVNVTNEELEYFGLKSDDRPNFREFDDLYYATYYGDKFAAPKGCDLKGEIILSENGYKNYKLEINSTINKINSNKFKETLILNFNKLKNIIENVCLKILLGRKNKIKSKLNKTLDRERHVERIQEQKDVNGYIYVLSNKSFPNYIKIGSTMRDPSIRAQELSDTSVPFPYVVKFKILTKNCEILEKKVHTILGKKRVDLEREFFECSIEEAKIIIENVVKIGE